MIYGPSATSAVISDSCGNESTTSHVDKATVLQELDAVLNSPAFRSSSRSKQFLSYVVQHKLEGRDELLKERTIGSELFRRRADYSTGDDPIVRVQAGDVRKRLEHYYQTVGHASAIRIELPVGAYVPEFHIQSTPVASEAPVPMRPRKKALFVWAVASVFVLALLAVSIFLVVRHATRQPSVLEQFWAPAFASSQPVFLYVSKPVLYRPSFDLYRRYASTHPGSFETEVERLNERLPLDGNEKLKWGDMIAFPDFGLGAGDVYAAFRISTLLNRMNKPNQLRIGSESSFDDLRNFPAVIIGAFSNRWTLEMTSNLRFVFTEKDGVFWIQDRSTPSRQWFCSPGKHWEVTEDYGIANRLLDSKTGQLVITVAGITASGSDAAAQFISNQTYLAEALRSAPPDWKNKNMQVVVKTQVVDSVAGPPQVIATYFW